MIPASRVAPLIRPYVERFGIEELARASGVSSKTIGEIINGRYQLAKFATVDKLLVGIGRPDLWLAELPDFYGLPGRNGGNTVNGSPVEAAGVLIESGKPPDSAASFGWSGAERTVSMARSRIAAPKGSRFGTHHVVGGRTLCGLDASSWRKVEKADEVTCPWCSIRLEHGVKTPTPMGKLPAEAREAIEKEVARRKRAAKRRAAA